MAPKRADKIAEIIEDKIFAGGYSNGDRLDEVSLAEHFGVSRTPIREALQKLSQSGLVEQIPRRGVFVSLPGPVELVQMFEVMAEIEGVCARLASTRVAPDLLSEMEAANQKCALAAEQNDADTYYYENEIFHQSLYRAAANSFLEQEAKRLQRRLSPFRRTQLQLKGRMEESLNEHNEIIESLRQGDTMRAGEVATKHVNIQSESFHHLISQAPSAAQ